MQPNKKTEQAWCTSTCKRELWQPTTNSTQITKINPRSQKNSSDRKNQLRCKISSDAKVSADAKVSSDEKSAPMQNRLWCKISSDAKSAPTQRSAPMQNGGTADQKRLAWQRGIAPLYWKFHTKTPRGFIFSQTHKISWFQMIKRRFLTLLELFFEAVLMHFSIFI